jgi:hypothetical protein
LQNSKNETQSKRQKLQPTEKDPNIQCASYALEMLSNGGLRSHVIGLLITDDNIELIYYDHSITMKAQSFSFVDRPVMFVAMLYAMSQLSTAQWGMDPVIENPSFLSKSSALPERRSKRFRSRWKIFENTEFKLDEKTTLILDKEVFHQHSIIGRGTCVIRARIKGAEEEGGFDDEMSERELTEGEDTDTEVEPTRNEKAKRASEPARIELDRQTMMRLYPLVVKFSYVPKGRESEVSVVRRLRELAFKEKKLNMLDHLPLILYDKDHPAQTLQQTLKKYFDERDKCLDTRLEENLLPTYEERVLRVTVQERLFSVLDLRKKYLRDQSKVAKVFRDIFSCMFF